MTWRILEGDCRDVLATLDASSVQTCVTSPPYFGLRDYGHDGQIGLEPTPDEFVAALVGVFREVRRVLRDDGTVWLNLGDSYVGGGGFSPESPSNLAGAKQTTQGGAVKGTIRPQGTAKAKDLLGIPWMVAFALRADGWYLRSDIIWSKPNPMPESVTDRPTKAHEYLFLLSKGPRYFYDADAIRETSDWGRENNPEWQHQRAETNGQKHPTNRNAKSGGFTEWQPEQGRNKRSVWTVATQPYPGAHFATFPAKLIEPCILAGSSPKACGVCGAPWQRVVERTAMVVKPTPKREAWQAEDDHARTQTGGTMLEPPTSRTVGWESSCGHQDDTGQSVVLDPFAGSGTTGMVALRHGRSFVGVELSPDYVRLARDRIIADSPLLNTHAEVAA
jgi:DNA modification methylase